MLSALKTKLDIGTEMNAGKIILIDNSKQKLGDEGAEFFGRFFIALVLAAAQQRAGRPQSDKLPCYFYIDECQNVIRRDEKISTILDECRSQKIAMIMAHQRSAQITSPNVLDALANCAIRMANSDDEAKYLADKLRTIDRLHPLTAARDVRHLRSRPDADSSCAQNPLHRPLDTPPHDRGRTAGDPSTDARAVFFHASET